MSKTNQLLNDVKNFSAQGIGVSRQTLSGASGIPINSVCSCVAKLLKDGSIVQRGQRAGRTTLWAA